MYQGKEVKMSTEINNFLSLSNSVKMKIGHYNVFGTIYSISMNSIKIIFPENEVLLALAKNKNLCDIEFKRKINSKKNSETCLPMKLLGISSYYYNNREYNLLILEFLSYMPEEIAFKVAKLFELKFNQNQRIHERIIVDKDSIKKLKINFDKAFIKFNGEKHKCLIKDLSYGGVLVISFFDYEDLNKDEINLVFSFEFMNKEIFIEGKAKSLSSIQTTNGKACAIGIGFEEDRIPFEYTMLIHEYFDQNFDQK